MKQSLPVILRQLLLLFIASLALWAALAGFFGIPFWGALGTAAGAVCIGTLVFRTWRAASLSEGAAKAQMMWGLILRLAVVAAAFFLSVKVGGAHALYAVVAGFFAYYIPAIALFAKSALRESGTGAKAPQNTREDHPGEGG